MNDIRSYSQVSDKSLHIGIVEDFGLELMVPFHFNMSNRIQALQSLMIGDSLLINFLIRFVIIRVDGVLKFFKASAFFAGLHNTTSDNLYTINVKNAEINFKLLPKN